MIIIAMVVVIIVVVIIVATGARLPHFDIDIHHAPVPDGPT